MLVAIIRAQPSALALKLANVENLNMLLKSAFDFDNMLVSVPVLNVCISAINPTWRLADGFGSLVGPANAAATSYEQEEASNQLFAPLIDEISNIIGIMVQYLENEMDSTTITSYRHF